MGHLESNLDHFLCIRSIAEISKRKDLKAHFDDDVKVSPFVYKNNSFVSFVSTSCSTHGSMYCISFGISTWPQCSGLIMHMIPCK